MDEKRRSSRPRQLKAAKASFNNGHASVPCTLRDLSESGCRLAVSSQVGLIIPDRFELIVEIDGTRADCEVVWRTGVLLGVRFLSPVRRGKPLRDQVINAQAPASSQLLHRKT
jgi:hypothetical protein